MSEPFFTISGPAFNAVVACAATKDRADQRPYLATFFVDVDARRIVATNGAIMAEAPLSGEGIQEDSWESLKPNKSGLRGFLFRAPTKPLLRSVEHVKLLVNSNSMVLAGARYTGASALSLTPARDSGMARFPDYRKASARDITPLPVKAIGLDIHWTARVVRWVGLGELEASFGFDFQEPSCAVRMRPIRPNPMWDSGLVFTYMPVRLP